MQGAEISCPYRFVWTVEGTKQVSKNSRPHPPCALVEALASAQWAGSLGPDHMNTIMGRVLAGINVNGRRQRSS